MDLVYTCINMLINIKNILPTLSTLLHVHVGVIKNSLSHLVQCNLINFTPYATTQLSLSCANSPNLYKSRFKPEMPKVTEN